MKNLLITLLHFAVVTAMLCGPGGVRVVIAENLVLKQQLIVLRRGRQQAPNLALSERLICGLASLFLSPGRIRKVASALDGDSLRACPTVAGGHGRRAHRRRRRQGHDGRRTCQADGVGLLMHGPGHLRTVLNDLAAWLQEHEWPSLAEMRGNMSLLKVPDPDAYERANYMLMLQGWRA